MQQTCVETVLQRGEAELQSEGDAALRAGGMRMERVRCAAALEP